MNCKKELNTNKFIYLSPQILAFFICLKYSENSVNHSEKGGGEKNIVVKKKTHPPKKAQDIQNPEIPPDVPPMPPRRGVFQLNFTFICETPRCDKKYF